MKSCKMISWHTKQQVQWNHLLHGIKDASLSGLLAIQLPGAGLATPTCRAARLSRPTAADAGNREMQTETEKNIIFL